MFVQRTAFILARRTPVKALARRTFSASVAQRNAAKPSKWDPKPGEPAGKLVSFEGQPIDFHLPFFIPLLLVATEEKAEYLFLRALSISYENDGAAAPHIETEADLLPPGAKAGSIPTDYEQATGLERLELLGKMHGVDVFDMRPLDSSRLGTLDNPIIVKSGGDEQYAGCTGFPADSHTVIWLTVSRKRPIERCSECGNVVKMEYIGPESDPHAHHDEHHHAYEEPKTMADFVRPEYWYK
ncbi:cytochrome c oxidase subunit 4, mitochondrial [Paracoccidioides brasiliensis Pb03]|nr:cytochrome c oxidase subunit 4, mitochondrial [Paracoccidioides brasiliensis Pb03]ODH52410.1 cytochrome c oxidase subunit 4, mitochondrial [Paracoccidioides brasiliensis]